MDEVTAYIPIFEQGAKVAELTIHVRANWDDALGGLTADVFFEDENGKRHAYTAERAKQVLDMIHDHDKDAWREINERAKERDLEGVYREPVYAA